MVLVQEVILVCLDLKEKMVLMDFQVFLVHLGHLEVEVYLEEMAKKVCLVQKEIKEREDLVDPLVNEVKASNSSVIQVSSIFFISNMKYTNKI